MDDITDRDIPFATDELDAIVEHTAAATHAILESCEMLDAVSASVSGEPAAKLQDAMTRIYEACSFQDITGQRITKVVTTLKMIEAKVDADRHDIRSEDRGRGARRDPHRQRRGTAERPATSGACDGPVGYRQVAGEFRMNPARTSRAFAAAVVLATILKANPAAMPRPP